VSLSFWGWFNNQYSIINHECRLVCVVAAGGERAADPLYTGVPAEGEGGGVCSVSSTRGVGLGAQSVGGGPKTLKLKVCFYLDVFSSK